MKYKQGDILIVYKETPTFTDGAVVQVIDRDPMDKSYSVAELQAVGYCTGDVQKLQKEYCKWVTDENVALVILDKPKRNIFVRLFRWMKKKILRR